jgi:hypothetical protein
MKTCFRYFFPFSILQRSDDHTYTHLKRQQSVSPNPWQLSALKQPITHESSTKGSPGYLGMVLCDTIVFRGAHHTITGVGCTHMVGLQLWGCCSRSHRYFVKALTVWTAVIIAQNGHITIYSTERFVPSHLSTTVSPLGSSKFCQLPLTPATLCTYTYTSFSLQSAQPSHVIKKISREKKKNKKLTNIGSQDTSASQDPEVQSLLLVFCYNNHIVIIQMNIPKI